MTAFHMCVVKLLFSGSRVTVFIVWALVSRHLSIKGLYLSLVKVADTTVQPVKRFIKNLNFHPLEVVCRYRDPQLQVGQNYSFV